MPSEAVVFCAEHDQPGDSEVPRELAGFLDRHQALPVGIVAVDLRMQAVYGVEEPVAPARGVKAGFGQGALSCVGQLFAVSKSN
mgnify:FL=1